MQNAEIIHTRVASLRDDLKPSERVEPVCQLTFLPLWRNLKWCDPSQWARPILNVNKNAQDWELGTENTASNLMAVIEIGIAPISEIGLDRKTENLRLAQNHHSLVSWQVSINVQRWYAADVFEPFKNWSNFFWCFGSPVQIKKPRNGLTFVFPL